MSPDVEAAARAAAANVTHETFSRLGFDISNQDALNGLHADLAFMGKLRRLHERAGMKIFLTVVGVAVGGILILFWSGFTASLKR